MKVFNIKKNKFKRRELRKHLTPAEALLWKHLKSDQLGVRFRRQYGILNYIVDFYSPRAKVVIELDGKNHLEINQGEYDTDRQIKLENLGLKVLRFENKDVLLNLDAVLEIIKENVTSQSNNFP